MVQKELHFLRDAESGHLVPHPGYYQDRTPDHSAPQRKPEDDDFGLLEVPAHPPFEVGAWIGGVLLDTQTVTEGQREVVFTTNLSILGQTRVPVSACFVDDVTGAPVEHVRMSASQAGGIETKTESNCGKLEVDPGWSVIQFDIDFAYSPETERTQYAPMALQIHGIAGRPIDLGTVRLAPARAARLRVVDAAGVPVKENEITVVRRASYDGSQAPFDLQRAWTKADGIVTFSRVAREQYVAMSTAPRLDSTPIVFDGGAVPDGTDSIVGTIVVRPVRQISLVFDDPPLIGTLMMIETPDGLPVRTLEMDEFGVVPLWLGGTDYRIHLVEDGSVTASVPLKIDSDPCIRRIKR
jgi:hypothetical protein